MAADNEIKMPLLNRLSDIENTLSLMKQQVDHPKAEDKIRFFERKLQSIDELREVIASFQKADELSRQNFVEKLKAVKDQMEGIHKNKEAIFENKKDLNSEIIKLSKNAGMVERRLEDIDKLKKRVEESEQDISLDFSKISRKINDIEDTVLKDSKSVFESRKRLDEHFAKTFNRLAEVEEELTVLRVIEKKIANNKIGIENRVTVVNNDLIKTILENKKITDKFAKDSIKKMGSVDSQLKEIPLLKTRITENEKEYKLNRKSVADNIFAIEKRREFLENNINVKNESVSIEFGRVNSQLETIFGKMSKTDLELAKIVILEKNLRDNKTGMEKDMIRVRDEFRKNADKKHEIFSDKLRAVNEELLKIGGVRKSVAMSEKNINIQNNSVLEKIRQVDKRSHEVRKALIRERIDVDLEFERVGKGVNEINRELKIFRDLGFAVNKIEQRKELDKIKKTVVEDKSYFVKSIANINKDSRSMSENLMKLNQFRDIVLEDNKVEEKRVLDLGKHFDILDKRIEKINLLEDIISKNKLFSSEQIKIAADEVLQFEKEARGNLESELAGVNSGVDELREVILKNKLMGQNDIKAAIKEMEQFSLGDRKGIEIEINKFALKINELQTLISDNKKIILNDFKMSSKEMRQSSFNDRKNMEIDISNFSKKINNFSKSLEGLDKIKQSIKDGKREGNLAIKTVSDKLNMVEGKLNHVQKYNSSSSGKQKLYEESVLKEILDGLKDNDKRIKVVEKESNAANDKVYVRLDEIIELVMFWEKRLNKLETYVNEMDYKRRKSLDDITSSVRKNSANVEIAKVKKEILSQLKKTHKK
ncbi:hypothetical protein KAS08_02130 [Candidatus Pacearchaeota archaeon]|nr:hypothetical protein [Candidatus Pacearchaeota archaeon]